MSEAEMQVHTTSHGHQMSAPHVLIGSSKSRRPSGHDRGMRRILLEPGPDIAWFGPLDAVRRRSVRFMRCWRFRQWMVAHMMIATTCQNMPETDPWKVKYSAALQHHVCLPWGSNFEIFRCSVFLTHNILLPIQELDLWNWT